MDKWLSHPTALKVLSVIIALLLWAVVHFDPEKTPATVTSNVDTKAYEAQSVVPIGLDDEFYALVKLEPTVVRVVVEGKRANLLALKDDDIVLNVDVSGLEAGEHTVPLSYKLPKGIELVEMSPTTVTVELVEIQTKLFDLGVITKGTPAKGYITGTPIFANEGNSQVEVTLPKEEMSHVGSVSITLSVEGAEKPIEEKKAKIVVYDTEGKPMEHSVIKPETVAVTLPVTPPFKMLPLQIGFTGSLPEGLSVSAVKPEIEKVAVYGEQKLLDTMESYKGATIDLSKIKGSGTYQVKLEASDGVKLVEPTEVNVELTIVSSETRTISRQIELNGLGEGLSANITSPEGGTASFEVVGAPNVLDALETGDVLLSVDLSGVAPGTYTMNVQASLPRFVQLAGSAEAVLKVTLDITDNSVSTGADPAGADTPEGGGEATAPPAGETAPAGESAEPNESGGEADAGSGAGAGAGAETGDSAANSGEAGNGG
ncbi:YbbR-like domain-containing protein [Paenibacillus sp. NEAU-GSW1]|uniref:CdaR family protein n=1 Tax=Paenibacillus sp. NEAU-GSW1 TaxID=2682486 RepID=UPI0012E2C2EC|nr:CdaR family protein [Paenibacillus sp. NEAU-GSW1]MUT67996.1 hypothetical protein [Paenibacillus sp. NEAU-GSW1]